ncbi:hypothetical protein DMC30DRAFT_402730 [Rhodotorula diobovata]|uniref:Uncharacterized protein n=1 Tax=Rhodotorula diobovata TaxID=5288 RepID=A0A5C5FNZ1_9BASI|nr:hypothetical protein DMC30DRAFT_402730 [Rhodotorula diobovata]
MRGAELSLELNPKGTPSEGHLLYAASPLLTRSLSRSTAPSAATTAAAAPPLSALLPPRFLLNRGGRDPPVLFSQATLLRNLLVRIGVGEARLRLCRDGGGLGSRASAPFLARPSARGGRALSDAAGG